MSEQPKGDKDGETQSIEAQDISPVHHKLQTTCVHSEFTLSTENTNPQTSVLLHSRAGRADLKALLFLMKKDAFSNISGSGQETRSTYHTTMN